MILKKRKISLTFFIVLAQFLFMACGPGADAAPKFASVEPPESLAATVVSENRVKIEWRQSGKDISGFSLERSLDGKDFREIAQLGADARDHLEAVLSTQTHYYRIRAFQQKGIHFSYSEYSNVDDATPSASLVSEPTEDAPPEVALTDPADGTVITSAEEIRLSAEATDDQSVASVEFYMNSEMVGVDASAPYEAILSISEADNGIHELYAIAYDDSGNSGRSIVVQITVDIPSENLGDSDESTTQPYTGGPLPVFPGAEGFGTKTPGGRGGQIIKVTNLNDSGAGSLRAALEASGPRIVVFEVGGVINLNSNITISSPYISVYGQSAPSPGIMLKNAGIRVFTHDVLIQHLAIRPGDLAGAYDDCITIEGGGANNFYNIVLDHLSLTWAQDEQFVVYSGAHDITLTNSILAAEGMGEKHGSLIGDTAPNITVRRNLFIHNHNRNPAFKGGAKAVVVNNVSYNFAGDASYLSDNYSKGPIFASYVGNVFLQGPWYNTSYNGSGIAVVSNVDDNSRVYQVHNYFDGDGRVYRNYANASVTASSSPLDLSSYTIETDWSKVQSEVLTNAGTRPAQRDSVDQRLVNDVINRTVSYKSDYPWYSTNYRTLALPADPHGDSDGNGYSNIEDLMHQMSAEVGENI